MNLDPQTQTGARNRSLLKIVAGLALAGVVIGLLTGVLGATALRAIGFKSEDTPPPASPSPTSTTSPEPTQETTEPSDSPTESDPPEKDAEDKDEPRLKASPAQVSPGQRINLSGSFPELHEGAVLQVQRREDGTWEDFPVVARTNTDGTFETWVVTERSGTAKFRLKAKNGSGKTPPAAVQIG